MSAPASTVVTRGESDSDPRVMQAVCAAIVAAALGVGQLLIAHLLGVWQGPLDRVNDTTDSAPIMIWTAALAVIAGAIIPRMLFTTTRRRITLSSMSAFGASLAAPIAMAVASWARMYGGELSQSDAVVLVLLGVLLGAAATIVIPVSRAMSWSMVGWSAAMWLIIAVTTATPSTLPLLGVLDPGPEWSEGGRLTQAILVAAFTGGVLGMLLGAGSTIQQWGVPRRARGRTLRYVPIPWRAAAGGPGLVLASYLLALAAGHDLAGPGLIAAAVAVAAAALASVWGTSFARAVG